MSLHDGDEDYQAWYKDRFTAHPFKLVRKIASKDPEAPAFRSLALFPWTLESSSMLWDGLLNTVENLPKWKQVIGEFWDAVAVGSDNKLYIFFTHQKKSLLCVKFPTADAANSVFKQGDLKVDTMRVAWALGHKAPEEPLVIFSRGSLLYIYNVVRQGISSYLRGHGGTITSIAVHPTMPGLFCTTSRDYTTRIYDLSLQPQKLPNNPCWPPNKKPSLAGAAHGLHSTEEEGSGLGRCIVVLMGGRSGGHQAAVLGAAFHPTLPLIATCGLDREVKIWVVRPENPEVLKREDKPIFSSSCVHKARVLSISWLQHDLLLTHSAPAIMREEPENIENKRTYLEAGEVAIWRWLGVDRFFPPVYFQFQGDAQQRRDMLRGLRGGSADYQESSSFKLISVHTLPSVASSYDTCKLSLFQSPTHDPLILLLPKVNRALRLANLVYFKPRQPPPFPIPPPAASNSADADRDGDGSGDRDLAQAAEQMNISEERTQPSLPHVEKVKPPGIDGWDISLDEHDIGNLEDCAMGFEGLLLVGVGEKGTLCVWRC